MTHRNTRSIQLRSFLPDVRITLTIGLTAAALLASTLGVRAQTSDAQPAAQTTTPTDAQPAAQTTTPKPDIALSSPPRCASRRKRR